MSNSVDNTYIDILIDSLKKKSAVLDSMMRLNADQIKLFEKKDFSDENFIEVELKKAADNREALTIELNNLDDGFEEVYKRVKEELQVNSQEHKEQIRTLQNLIKEITDKTVQINVESERVNKLVQAGFSKQYKESMQKKTSASAAKAYYKEMSKVDTITPQFMDKRN